MTESELKNQADLIDIAERYGRQKMLEITEKFIENTTPMVLKAGKEQGYLQGFWFGFAAGAFGVMLALAVTWLIYGA